MLQRREEARYATKTRGSQVFNKRKTVSREYYKFVNSKRIITEMLKNKSTKWRIYLIVIKLDYTSIDCLSRTAFVDGYRGLAISGSIDPK